MAMLQQIFGEQGARFAIWALTILILLVAVLLLWGLIRRALGDRLNMSDRADRRGRPPRLGITESFTVDHQGRRLVIVRRDNVEHLIMIGGPNDLVVEAGFVRGERPVLSRPEARVAESELIPPLAIAPAEPIAPAPVPVPPAARQVSAGPVPQPVQQPAARLAPAVPPSPPEPAASRLSLAEKIRAGLPFGTARDAPVGEPPAVKTAPPPAGRAAEPASPPPAPPRPPVPPAPPRAAEAPPPPAPPQPPRSAAQPFTLPDPPPPPVTRPVKPPAPGKPAEPTTPVMPPALKLPESPPAAIRTPEPHSPPASPRIAEPQPKQKPPEPPQTTEMNQVLPSSPPAAPKAPATANPFDSLEEEMARLLGRAPGGKG
jgi:hypothetical protein